MKRRGASLVQLLVLMSVSAFILALSAGLIQRLMLADSRTRHFSEYQQRAARLASLFRADVHQSASRSERAADEDEALVRLAAGQDQVTYSARGGVVVRTVTYADGQVGREEFAFPSHIQASAREDDGCLVLTLLRAETPADPSESRQRSPYESPFALEVVARLGRDRAPAQMNPSRENMP